MFVHLHGDELPVILGTDEELNSDRLPSGERAQRMQPPEPQIASSNGKAKCKLKSVPEDQGDHAF